MSRNTQSKAQAQNPRIIAGIGSVLPRASTVTLLGKAYSPADLTQVFQDQLDAIATLNSLKAQVKEAVATARAKEKTALSLAAALRDHVTNEHGPGAITLAEFGFAPKKPMQKDPVTHVIAAERMRATRKERRTMGRVQRSKIKGKVPPVIAIPTGAAEMPGDETAEVSARPDREVAGEPPSGAT